MKTSDFYYDLPEELIAQDPLADRSASRLLVLDKETGERTHTTFRHITEFLRPGDCLVLNDTKVLPARLYGVKAGTGTKIEVLLLKQEEEGVWETLVRPGRKCRVGTEILFYENTASFARPENADAGDADPAVTEALENEDTDDADPAGTEVSENKDADAVDPAGSVPSDVKISGEAGPLMRGVVTDILEDGNRRIRFTYSGIFPEILDRLGEMPLPPYITHKLKDRDRYQTVYAEHDGSAAAPTAGLHFTDALLGEISGMGVEIARVTLHVGLGTFRPVKVDDVTQHHMHSEYYVVPQEAADLVNRTKAKGGRIICVGTTSCRTLETAADTQGILYAGSGWTDIFIYPGYSFKIMDALITNFHLPESTLLMLVSAFAGKEKIMAAYEEAIRERYRFFSFGDAMFIK